MSRLLPLPALPARSPSAAHPRPLIVLAALGVSLLSSLSSLSSPVAHAAQTPVGDRLSVTVRHAGAGFDGTFELYCHPGGGSHPDSGAACDRLDRITQWGRDTFAPVPDDSVCTLQYGGPATAHVTGTWAGRPVDASFDRRDGCHIGQWDRLVPLLPDLSPRPQGSS
ncbi:hypothetical protein ELQ87_19840 [Streptomyces griseoviridis]|uniref:Subtilisin inhibitor domain-containing protein n=1 Tax=Streptomyces griseoviridis TaxID=45398 RepID=A0A3Q9KUF4_STRGD|nr:SSI family serine proteinase inhibitor [Streptomyces griseoviridis]AZS86273.1 hypothetical protein ELQ87_19840 [Streptomyces griseoviridis]QCN86865.1 hypothetical protein DDJ31_19445 [Streptomyces griseoviridis]